MPGGALHSRAAPPAEELLGPVGGNDRAENEAKDQQAERHLTLLPRQAPREKRTICDELVSCRSRIRSARSWATRSLAVRAVHDYRSTLSVLKQTFPDSDRGSG